MSKFRSKTNYAQTYSGDKQGFNLGLDGAIYLKRETTRGTFVPPAIGTQGKSAGDVSASIDISAAASPGTIKVQLGYPTGVGAVVTASVITTGLTSGLLIAAALELAINTALSADGQDGRVWVEYTSGDVHYTVWNQSTGTFATVAITDGVSNNLADNLKLGVPNGGTETAGTNDTDFLLYTTGGLTFQQPVESNQHRSGRFHSGIIRKKKVCEFDFDTYINMSGDAGDSLDNAVQLLLEACLGKKTTTPSMFIDFEQDLPVIYMSMVRISTIFGEYYTGGYVKDLTLTYPGDGPATAKYAGKAADCFEAGIAQVNGPVSASTDVILNAGESTRFTAFARVMAVAADGRTITAGADGSLYVASYDDSTEKIVLSTAVTLADNTYIVPWDPGAVQQTARDAIFTDLLGTFKMSQSGQAVDVTNTVLSLKNDHNDFDNRYGSDTNKGFAAGNRLTGELAVTFDLSNETYGTVVRSREFAGYNPELVLGSTSSGRYMKVTAPNWIPAVPAKEVPENGTTPTTLTGNLFTSTPGAKDPFRIRFG